MSKRSEQQVRHDIFALMYTSFVNKVVKDGAGKDGGMFRIGARIGERMADDFFFTASPRKPMGLLDVSRDVSETFFPHYFSFRPAYSQGIIALGKFPMLQYTRREKECLEMICGILEGVYGYVSKEGISFEASEYNGEYCIIVRDGERKDPVVMRFNEEVDEGQGICFEPRDVVSSK
ncbi:transport protein particle component [Encephalitozoon hellem ATCC 50504]|uniref:Trafficking protein particle complex subunit BET3 n=1 Tax=Encephalitozoon hellem TaxID=27973 RepID=A0A9Q9F7S4_ENCHE|nr:transport protein particle component [Encephalitozoon hellem ATCC 50504]AFM97844.1 transport protein particle component [Encephalitozoon hellem ATCC 50504]UTX42623.1 trafficking protein particle complex subunit BET3-like protein [Encephalitozoon hellem]WEL38079.1 trafficking protein particle complex subunit BET3 [Encephalitozoon hellem]|eukprot:XP_003886825.1 transport protein particle component [Encephalitozoon hellem ATCC 50504]